MRVVSIGVSTILLIIMLNTMQHHSVEAKPFIFKFFVPQAPARTASSSSSSLSSSSSSSSASSSSSPSISTGIDFTSILSTKLNLLTSLLRAGVTGGFNIGFNKFFPNIRATSTRRPYTSTTATTPDVEFETESTTKSILKSTTTTTTTSAASTTTESSKSDKNTGSDNLSEPIEDNKDNNKVTTERNDNDHVKATTQRIETVDSNKQETTPRNSFEPTTSKTAAMGYENNGYDYTTTKIIVNGNNNNNGNGYDHTTARSNVYGVYSTPRNGYNYDNSNYPMNENEISNEIMMINNQYLPTF